MECMKNCFLGKLHTCFHSHSLSHNDQLNCKILCNKIHMIELDMSYIAFVKEMLAMCSLGYRLVYLNPSLCHHY